MKYEEALTAYQELKRAYPHFQHNLRSLVSLTESCFHLKRWADVEQLYGYWLQRPQTARSTELNFFIHQVGRTPPIFVGMVLQSFKEMGHHQAGLCAYDTFTQVLFAVIHFYPVQRKALCR